LNSVKNWIGLDFFISLTTLSPEAMPLEFDLGAAETMIRFLIFHFCSENLIKNYSLCNKLSFHYYFRE